MEIVQVVTSPLCLVAIALALLFPVVLLTKGKKAPRGAQYHYRRLPYLLSKAERSFYGALIQATEDTGLVFAKVRVADVLQPRRGGGRSDWQRAFNAISSKHFDFVICDPRDCAYLLAVELDDSSHASAKSQTRDRFLNAACESAELPLLRVPAQRAYSITGLRESIETALASPEKKG